MEQELKQEILPPISPEVQVALRDLVEKNPYMQELKIDILEIERGFVKGKLTVTDKVLNPYGSVHGGCLFSLADITAGLAACTYGVYSSTIDGNMEYSKIKSLCEIISLDINTEIHNAKVTIRIPDK